MADERSRYPDQTGTSTVAQVERRQLCDLFEALGPSAPTLCEGWDAHHLAAHLVLREHSVLSTARLMVQMSGDEAVAGAAATRPFESLVAELREGPPRFSLFALPVADRLGNGMEFFVHHEDVRRARRDFTARELPVWAHDELWRSVSLAAKAVMRKAPVGVALRRRDTGAMRVACKGDRTVIVDGLPSELALFALGRGAVAEVAFDGNPLAVETVRGLTFTI